MRIYIGIWESEYVGDIVWRGWKRIHECVKQKNKKNQKKKQEEPSKCNKFVGVYFSQYTQYSYDVCDCLSTLSMECVDYKIMHISHIHTSCWIALTFKIGCAFLSRHYYHFYSYHLLQIFAVYRFNMCCVYVHIHVYLYVARYSFFFLLSIFFIRHSHFQFKNILKLNMKWTSILQFIWISFWVLNLQLSLSEYVHTQTHIHTRIHTHMQLLCL